MKKKVTIVLNTLATGGAEHMVYELLKSLDTDRFDVNLLCYMKREDTLLAQQVEKQFPVTYLNQSGSITPKTVGCVVRAIRKTRPDVVHAHLGGIAFGAIWTLLFRKPLVATVHTKPAKAFSKKTEKRFAFINLWVMFFNECTENTGKPIAYRSTQNANTERI